MTSLLQIKNLKTILHTSTEPVRAVDELTLQIEKGEETQIFLAVQENL